LKSSSEEPAVIIQYVEESEWYDGTKKRRRGKMRWTERYEINSDRFLKNGEGRKHKETSRD
jgi:hypothetical protein